MIAGQTLLGLIMRVFVNHMLASGVSFALGCIEGSQS